MGGMGQGIGVYISGSLDYFQVMAYIVHRMIIFQTFTFNKRLFSETGRETLPVLKRLNLKIS